MVRVSFEPDIVPHGVSVSGSSEPTSLASVLVSHPAFTHQKLATFLRSNLLAVVSSTSASGQPRAAVVGVVVGERCELFFDTLKSSRKCGDLRRDPRVAAVVGWDLTEGCTAQLEGDADEPSGAQLEAWKQLYFGRFPDGLERQAWPDITYFRIRTTWARFSDFRTQPPTIVEFDAAALNE